MIYKLGSVLLLCFALSLLSSAEPLTWRITEDGIFIRVAKGLNPRDPTISEEYHVGGSDKWGTPSHGPAGRMFGITPLAPLLLSGRDLASLGNPLHIAQRLGQDSSQDSVLARLRGEDPTQDKDAPQLLKNHAQLLALRIAMDQGWQAALPICTELLHSDNPFLARAAQQAVAVLADGPHDQGSLPSLPPLQAAVSSLPSDSLLIVHLDARQAPRWRNPQHSMRQLSYFNLAVRYMYTGGIITPAMIGDDLLYTEELTVLPLFLAQRYGNLRVDRTLLALTPSQDMPVGFYLLIEGAFTLEQMTAIAQDADLEIHDGSIDLGFLQADLADGQLRIFTKGTSQGDEGPDWFDSAAAAKTFLYAAAPPEGIQTLSQLIGPLPEQLAGLSDVVAQVQTPGADMQLSGNLHFDKPGLAEEIRQMLSMLEINQQEQLNEEESLMRVSLIESTRLLEFVKPIWDQRKTTADEALLSIQLTWPDADIADLLNASATLRPAWEQQLTKTGMTLDLEAVARRIASEHAAIDAETED